MDRAAEAPAPVEAIRALGRPVAVHAADVRDHAAAARVVDAVVAESGRLDILVCSAGITADATLTWKMTEDEWDRVIAVNLKGCFNYCQAAARRFTDAEGRQDRQHRLDQRPARQVRAGQLRRLQGRAWWR